jgi:E3 ubiquitin-protein ligase HERC1
MASPLPKDGSPLVSCSATHCLELEATTRRVLSWARTRAGNRFGQLGRGKDCVPAAAPVAVPGNVVSVSAGGGNDAGHSAVVTESGQVYTWGCDRWQQLGMGSTGEGAQNTWAGGKLWQVSPQLLCVGGIAAVACGADHTVALKQDGRTVLTWGRGEHGQLGRRSKLFVGAPARSDVLSLTPGEGQPIIARVVAIENCSATLRADGTVIQTAGKCKHLRLVIEAYSTAAAFPPSFGNS